MKDLMLTKAQMVVGIFIVAIIFLPQFGQAFGFKSDILVFITQPPGWYLYCLFAIGVIILVEKSVSKPRQIKKPITAEENQHIERGAFLGYVAVFFAIAVIVMIFLGFMISKQ